MIYSQENTIIWKYVFSYLENLNTVKEVSRLFVNRNWITRISVKMDLSVTRYTPKLRKMFKTRKGGVKILDLSQWTSVNASSVNKIMSLKAFRGLEELILGDCVNVRARFLDIPRGIKITASPSNNIEVHLLNMKNGNSSFKEKLNVFYSALRYEESFFLEVCDVLDLQMVEMTPLTYTELYNLCAGKVSPICMRLGAKGGLLLIEGGDIFLMINEKDNKFCLEVCSIF